MFAWLDGQVEAVIVAGGLGTRLLPLTEFQPKPLLPVAGVPFVVHQLAKLAAAGIRRVVLATSYHADQFQPVLGDGDAWGLELVYVTEGEPLGTGGAIRNVASDLRSRPGDPVVILNGDVLSGHDLRGQLASHRDTGADVTLHLVTVADPRAYGCVPTDAGGVVTGFFEKSPHPVSTQINAGCYVFTREIIDRIPPGDVVSVERETFPQLLAAGGLVTGYLQPAYWLDVGTPQALCRASADLVLGVTTSPAYEQPAAEFWVSPDAHVSPTASLVAGSSVGPAATVGEHASLSASLVCSGAEIGASSEMVNTVIGPAARIGAGAVLYDAVVGENAVVSPGRRLPPGTKVASRSPT